MEVAADVLTPQGAKLVLEVGVTRGEVCLQLVRVERDFQFLTARQRTLALWSDGVSYVLTELGFAALQLVVDGQMHEMDIVTINAVEECSERKQMLATVVGVKYVRSASGIQGRPTYHRLTRAASVLQRWRVWATGLPDSRKLWSLSYGALAAVASDERNVSRPLLVQLVKPPRAMKTDNKQLKGLMQQYEAQVSDGLHSLPVRFTWTTEALLRCEECVLYAIMKVEDFEVSEIQDDKGKRKRILFVLDFSWMADAMAMVGNPAPQVPLLRRRALPPIPRAPSTQKGAVRRPQPPLAQKRKLGDDSSIQPAARGNEQPTDKSKTP